MGDTGTWTLSEIPVQNQWVPNHNFRQSFSVGSQKQRENALHLANLLTYMGWSFNAVCAGIGSWIVECYLNPNYPNSSTFPATGTKYAFGLPHWYPWNNKLGLWAKQTYGLEGKHSDDNPLANAWLQCIYHEWECRNGSPLNGRATWVNNHGWHYAWTDWRHSTDSLHDLCYAYQWQYEQSKGGDRTASYRQKRAEEIQTFLQANWTYTDPSGGGPGPTPPGPPTPHSPSNFLIVAKAAGLF